MLEFDRPLYEKFLAAGHAPTLDVRGHCENEYVDERGVEKFVERGERPPEPRGDPDLTPRQRGRLAEACRSVLRVALGFPTCS